MSQKRHHHNLIWGVILVVLGFIFLLENFGLDIWEHVGKLWPLVLIIWGASKLQAALRTRSLEPTQKQTEEGKNLP